MPPGADAPTLLMLCGGYLLLYLPTYWDLLRRVWSTDAQGHGPIILGVSAWLLWHKRADIAACPSVPVPALGWPLVVIALLAYALGRSQDIAILEVGSQIVLLVGLFLLFKGWKALRVAWFPLFFLLFMVPLPGPVVAALTGPLKAAVSYVAAGLLHWAGYPVGRSGVMLTVGPYQLLVADACAGLNSIFTLEALGLLYMNLMAYTSVARNVALAILVVPIAFVSNVVRVLVLVLVTYYFGDEAGQGFVHDFAGLVLFSVGLMLVLGADKLLGLHFDRRSHRSGGPG